MFFCCLVLLFSVVICLFLLILATPINKIPTAVNNKINQFLNADDLISLSKVDKKNNQNVKNMTFGKELNDIHARNTKNTKNIKRLLLTNQGIAFIRNLNNLENQKLWNLTIQQNDIKLLRGLNKTGIKMTLSNNQLVGIIESYFSFCYYETIEFLFDYIKTNEDISGTLLIRFLLVLTTPKNKKQQHIQLEIVKKLIYRNQIVANWLKVNFYVVVKSLNIPLVDFVRRELGININRLFGVGNTVLQIVVGYLKHNTNQTNDFAYEMFDHLLKIGANVNTIDIIGNDVYYKIKQIETKSIKNKLEEIIENHR